MFRCKGRVALPNRMSFRKSAKGGAGVIFNPKIDIADFGPIKGVFFLRFPKKNCNTIFQNEGWGSKAVWNLSENSSDLVASPFPNN